jgi:hypothetical protein
MANSIFCQLNGTTSPERFWNPSNAAFNRSFSLGICPSPSIMNEKPASNRRESYAIPCTYVKGLPQHIVVLLKKCVFSVKLALVRNEVSIGRGIP